ncbi:MAG: ribosome maturation factor RimM [Candidatus Binatia bacterium]
MPLGRLGSTHGVRGELRLLPYASPSPMLQPGRTVSLQGKDGSSSAFILGSVRPHPPALLITFEGVDSLEQAQLLRGAEVSVEEEMLPPLREGEFYYYQVIGLRVLTTTGEEIGTIAQVFFSGGHDVWVVRQGKKEHLIPVTEEIVRTIDIAGGRVIIEPLEGLLE